MDWEQVDYVAQAGIVLAAYITPHLKASRSPRMRLWGFGLGLCATPFWMFTSLWPTLKVGIFLANISYAVSYLRGIYNNLDRNQ